MRISLTALILFIFIGSVLAMDGISPMQKHNQVDVVSLTPDSSTIVLSLVETRPWDAKGENLLDLQAKLNTYLDFIESGQLIQKYPQAKGKKIVLRLQYSFAPNAQALEFIELAKRKYLAPASIGFEASALK